MFNQIVVGTDGSTGANIAVDAAIELARMSGATLHVVNALAWAWYMVSENSEVEARLQEESDAVLGGRPPEAEDLPRLAYTQRVFKESLRLYPPAWIGAWLR